jgi:hypothetical protein
VPKKVNNVSKLLIKHRKYRKHGVVIKCIPMYMSIGAVGTGRIFQNQIRKIVIFRHCFKLSNHWLQPAEQCCQTTKTWLGNADWHYKHPADAYVYPMSIKCPSLKND